MPKPSIWSPGGPNADRGRRSGKPGIWTQGGRAGGPAGSVRTRGRAPARAEAPPKRREKRKYTVIIDAGWCKNCGICSAFCPTGTLEDAGHGEPRITDMDLCNGCQLCVVRCPDFAIIVEERSSNDGG